MTAKIPCYIEFTDSGYFLRIVHRSGFIIGEFLINDSNLSIRAIAAHDRLGKQAGIPSNFRESQNPYHGEITEVVGNEIIREEIENLEGMFSNWFDEAALELRKDENKSEKES